MYLPTYDIRLYRATHVPLKTLVICISSIFKVQYSHSRQQKTTSNFLRITLKGRLGSQQWMITSGSYMYVHKPMVKFSGASLKKSFANISKHWWFHTKLTRLLEVIKRNWLEKILIFFIIYQIYTLLLIAATVLCRRNTENLTESKH